MGVEIKTVNLQNQDCKAQAEGFLSRKQDIPAGALIPMHYWPDDVRRQYQAQIKEKNELARNVYKPERTLERSIEKYELWLAEQRWAIERYQEYKKLHEQGLLTERGIREMEAYRGAILGKMGPGRSHDPLVENYYKQASKAFEKGLQTGDFSDFFKVVEDYRKTLEEYVRYYRWLQQRPPHPDFQVTTVEQQYYVEAHREGYYPLDLGYGPGIARAYLHQSLKDLTSLPGLKNSEAVQTFLALSEMEINNKQVQVLNLDRHLLTRLDKNQDERVKALNPLVAKAWAGFVRYGLYDSDGKKYDDLTLMKLWGFNNLDELKFARAHLFGAIREEPYLRGKFSGISSENFRRLSEEKQQAWLRLLERDFLRLWGDTRRMY